MRRKNHNHRKPHKNTVSAQQPTYFGLPGEVEIKARSQRGLIITFGILTAVLMGVWSTSWFFPEGFDSGGALFFNLFMGSLSLFILNLTIVSCLRLKDWAKASSGGLEFYLHSSFSLCFLSPRRVFIPWDKVEQFATYDVTTKGNVVCHLLIKLEDETEISVYKLDHLQGHGHPIALAISKYKNLSPSAELEQNYESANKEGVVDYLLCGLFVLGIIVTLFTLELSEHTMVPYWYSLPFLLVVVGGAVCAYKILKRHIARIFLAAVPVLSFLVFGFLYVNYHFAKWNSPSKVRTYKVVNFGTRETKSGDLTGYYLKIEFNKTTKDLDFEVEQECDLRNADVVDLYLHNGFFGFPVYKKCVPRNMKIENGGL